MASFDPDLEHLIIDIMKYDLNHTLAIAIEQAYIIKFDEFRSIEIADVNGYTITDASTKVTTKFHGTLVKAVQRGVTYARYEEYLNYPESDDPTKWDAKAFSKWTQNRYVNYLNTTAANAAALAATTIGSTTTQKADQQFHRIDTATVNLVRFTNNE
jgi:hypothetical protein